MQLVSWLMYDGYICVYSHFELGVHMIVCSGAKWYFGKIG